MKTKLILKTLAAAALLLSSYAVQAQNKLTFCEDVETDGTPKGVYNTFTIPEAGAYLYFHVKMENGSDVGTDDIGYEIYRIGDDGKETYSTTIYQTTKSEWDVFWSAVTFYNPGKYKVKVIAWYGDDDWWGTEIASGTVTIEKE
jgi:hypothetical protein